MAGLTSSIVLIAATVTLLGKQTAPPQQTPPIFRGATDLIQVDTTVLDKNHQPVRGLTAKDFTVLEDGRPRPVDALAEINTAARSTSSTAAAWTRDVGSDVDTNRLPDGRLIVIVIDDATSPHEPKIVENAKKIGLDIVHRLGPQDSAAVVFTRDNRAAQDFTSDAAKLIAAINRFTPGDVLTHAWFGDKMDNFFWYPQSVRVLSDVTADMQAVPNRRKAVFYISSGVPVPHDELAATVAFGAKGNVDTREQAVRISDLVGSVVQKAAGGVVNVYAIDPSGLNGFENYLTFLQQRSGGRIDIGGAHDKAASHLEYLQTVANATGGHALINTSDFGPGLAEIFDETSSYYLLGFPSGLPTKDGRYHRIDVKVNRPDVTVQARRGYYAMPPALAKTAATTTAMASLLPSNGLSLQVTTAPFASMTSPGQGTVAFVLHVQMPASADLVAEKLDLMTRVFDPEGKPVTSQQQTATLALAAHPEAETQYEVLSKLDLKPGRYEARLSAHSDALKADGSVYTDFIVPDFAKEPLSMSAVVLSEMPGPPAIAKAAITGLVPVVPTATRAFATTDHVTAFLRVYEGGKTTVAPVRLSLRIVDDHDAEAFQATGPVDADRFGTSRAADYRFDLPLTSLKPGPHLLTVQAALGAATVTRQTVFTVR
jgi:VWFA-related protein